jgi:hypothetical protein
MRLIYHFYWQGLVVECLSDFSEIVDHADWLEQCRYWLYYSMNTFVEGVNHEDDNIGISTVFFP